MMQIKEELEDAEVDIGTTTLQQVDSHYRTNQQDTIVIKMENVVANSNVDATLCRGVKQESIGIKFMGEDVQKGAQATLTPVGAGIVMQSFHITVEGGNLVIIPTVLQHRTNQNASVKTENVTGYGGNDPMPCSRVKEESVDNCADAGPDIYICDYCQKTFPKKFKIVAHITSVHAGGSYKCHQCEWSFKCKSDLKLHRTYMHTIAVKKQCKICGKKFRPAYLKLHMLSVHNDKTLDFQCRICGAVTSSNMYLHYHMNYFHSQQTIVSPFVKRCEYCLKIYSVERLKAHIRTAHKCVFHRCSICKADFKSENSLWRHMKLVHSKDKHEEDNHQSTCSNMGKESGENTQPPVGEVNASASMNTQQQDLVVMKEEPAAVELELGPVVFQHMDCNFRPYKEEPLLDL